MATEEPSGSAAYEQPDDVQLPGTPLQTDADVEASDGEWSAPTALQWQGAALFFILASFVSAYRLLVLSGLEQSSALFVGIPAMLGALLMLMPPPRSATGMAFKATALCLLLSGVVLGEGIICIAMASPLFFGITMGIGLVMDLSRRRGDRANSWVLAVLLVMSTEGAVPGLSFEREQQVEVRRWVDATETQVRDALAGPQELSELPVALRLGFPVPVETWGEGLTVGDTRAIRFAGGEGQPGVMAFRVREVGAGYAVFELVEDGSHIAHWLRWHRSTVRWEAAEGGTQVSWTVDYRRDLDPAWYFSGLQQLFVGIAAEHLIDSVATP